MAVVQRLEQAVATIGSREQDQTARLTRVVRQWEQAAGREQDAARVALEETVSVLTRRVERWRMLAGICGAVLLGAAAVMALMRYWR